jgi:hypothetical protein
VVVHEPRPPSERRLDGPGEEAFTTLSILKFMPAVAGSQREADCEVPRVQFASAQARSTAHRPAARAAPVVRSRQLAAHSSVGANMRWSRGAIQVTGHRGSTVALIFFYLRLEAHGKEH